MKADQLELIAEKADRYADYVVEGCDGVLAACRDARAESVSKRTPITPAALFAAGWVYDTGDCAYRHPCIGDHVECEFNLADEPMVSVAGWRVFANSMHDINELVRLLGGAK